MTMKPFSRAALFLLLCGAAAAAQQAPAAYDIVLRNGRVMDPASGLDAVGNVGITGKKIVAVSTDAMRGRIDIDAAGLVVAPGFIDLHSHGQTPENYRYKAMDGVTSALELEVGASPIGEWYKAREGKSLIHFGASAGHIPARMAVMKDSGSLLPRDNAMNRPATAEEQRTSRRWCGAISMRAAWAWEWGSPTRRPRRRKRSSPSFSLRRRSGGRCSSTCAEAAWWRRCRR